jgi:hypothetical protein
MKQGMYSELCFIFLFCELLRDNTRRANSSSNPVQELEPPEEMSVRHLDAVKRHSWKIVRFSHTTFIAPQTRS